MTVVPKNFKELSIPSPPQDFILIILYRITNSKQKAYILVPYLILKKERGSFDAKTGFTSSYETRWSLVSVSKDRALFGEPSQILDIQ
jgi:hypothetical protein